MSELLDIIVNTLDEKQAEDIVSIDMRNVTPFTDYFVVCTARNDTLLHLRNLLSRKQRSMDIQHV